MGEVRRWCMVARSRSGDFKLVRNTVKSWKLRARKSRQSVALSILILRHRRFPRLHHPFPESVPLPPRRHLFETSGRYLLRFVVRYDHPPWIFLVLSTSTSAFPLLRRRAECIEEEEFVAYFPWFHFQDWLFLFSSARRPRRCVSDKDKVC